MNEWYCKSGNEKFPFYEYYTETCDICEQLGTYASFKMLVAVVNAHSFHKSIPKERRIPPPKPGYRELTKKDVYYRDWKEFSIQPVYPICQFKLCTSCNFKLHLYYKGLL